MITAQREANGAAIYDAGARRGSTSIHADTRRVNGLTLARDSSSS